MKKTAKTISALSVAAAAVVASLNTAQAQDVALTKVTGGGTYEEYLYPTVDVAGVFDVSINPEKKATKKSPQAVIEVDGVELRKFWGGPLKIQGDIDLGLVLVDPENPSNPKPPQAFKFVTQHPTLGGSVAVWVFLHDNATAGYNREDPLWSDWIMVWIEPEFGDGMPYSGDDLFLNCGIVRHGNVMDHRQ